MSLRTRSAGCRLDGAPAGMSDRVRRRSGRRDAKGQLTSDLCTMDFPLHTNRQRYYGVNGGTGQNSEPDEDALKFLSQEEQECIQFFEKTIDYLEGSLEEDELRTRMSRSNPVEEVDGPANPSPGYGMVPSIQVRSPSHSQDIIDLVQPDLIQTREPLFNPADPDFQSLAVNPETHFETKPIHEPMDGFLSEYNPPLPAESHAPYHPPGSIPTPVLIAQKIANNQAGGSSSVHPAAILHRHSKESVQPTSYSADPQVRQATPTSAKPNRFPANIHVILGSKEQQNQSLANVRIQERQAQMLANLAGTSHPLLQDPSQQASTEKSRNIPTRSISFKDPTPEKSRMEALSKLGLARNRALSGGTSLLPATTSVTPAFPVGSDSKERLVPETEESCAQPLAFTVPTTEDTSAKSPVTSSPATAEIGTNSPGTTPRLSPGPYTSPFLVNAHTAGETGTRPQAASASLPGPSQTRLDRQPETVPTHAFSSPDEKRRSPSSLALGLPKTAYQPPHFESTSPRAAPPEVSSLEVNSYGGKSIVVNPSASSRSERLPSPGHDRNSLPPALAKPAEVNPYGGKSKVMTPSAAPASQSDLPDILSSHIDRGQAPRSPSKLDALPVEINSYGGKSRTIAPLSSSNPSGGSSRSFKPPAPATAPKPARHSHHAGANANKMGQHARSPDHRPKSVCKPAMFRPAIITVQFSGRGPMDEARREALRRLGLLKDS